MIRWERTDPENFVFLFESILIKDWGSTIEVVSAGDTEGSNIFKTSFFECREIRWDIIDPDSHDLSTPAVTVIGFDLGEEGYTTAAIIHGGFFELRFYYKMRQIIKQE